MRPYLDPSSSSVTRTAHSPPVHTRARIRSHPLSASVVDIQRVPTTESELARITRPVLILHVRPLSCGPCSYDQTNQLTVIDVHSILIATDCMVHPSLPDLFLIAVSHHRRSAPRTPTTLNCPTHRFFFFFFFFISTGRRLKRPPPNPRRRTPTIPHKRPLRRCPTPNSRARTRQHGSPPPLRAARQ